MSFRNRLLFVRLAKESIKENSIVINAVIRPNIMIRIAGNIDSTILSSPAYWKILTDNVSKSNGLKIKVIGNSFIVSTKTKSEPTNIGPWRSGR